MNWKRFLPVVIPGIPAATLLLAAATECHLGHWESLPELLGRWIFLAGMCGFLFVSPLLSILVVAATIAMIVTAIRKTSAQWMAPAALLLLNGYGYWLFLRSVLEDWTTP